MSTPPGGWWTPAIIDQIRKMRTTGSFFQDDQLILANRLEAAGCPHHDVIASLRLPLKPWAAAREIALLLGGEYQDAVWLLDAAVVRMQNDQYDVEVDFDWYVQSYVDFSKSREQTELTSDPGYTTVAVQRQLWTAFTNVTGIQYTKTADNPFYFYEEEGLCSC